MIKTYLYYKDFSYAIFYVKQDKKEKFFVEKKRFYKGKTKTTMHQVKFTDEGIELFPRVRINKKIEKELNYLRDEVLKYNYNERLIFLKDYFLL